MILKKFGGVNKDKPKFRRVSIFKLNIPQPCFVHFP